MQSWYGLWINHTNKHQELLREAERERRFNSLRVALRIGSSSKSEQAAERRKSGKLAPDPA
jgi:hypothetical protein